MSCILAALLSEEELVSRKHHRRTVPADAPEDFHRPRTATPRPLPLAARRPLRRRSSDQRHHLLRSPPLLRNYGLIGRRPRWHRPSYH